MQFIMFTKHLEGLELAGLIRALTQVGVAGADLCVRPGYPVNPENMSRALPDAARQFAAAGLTIPLVTAPTSLNRPDNADAPRFYAACAAAGVPRIKIGYWHWNPAQLYRDQLALCREYLAGFAELSRQYGVQTLVHTHSGHSMGLNASAAMSLAQGFDPAAVGIFVDPGHLAICGEPIDMALDIVGDYLGAVAFKDLLRERVSEADHLTWRAQVRRLGEGFVDWRTTLAALQARAFPGPISLHSEYGGEPPESVIDLTRCDLRFVRRLQAERV